MANVDIIRLERAICIVASLVEQSGDSFWPIFDRLESEREIILMREARLRRYLPPTESDQGQSETPETNHRLN